MKNERGDRGKAAEKAVEDVLRQFNQSLYFAYWRLPDARAAMGRLAAQPGDFVYFSNGRGGIIEAKETKHDFRIAKDKISQLAVLHKLAEAGARSLIVVHHSTTDLWRAVRPEHLKIGPPSWDLSEFPTYKSAEAALHWSGLFE